MKINMIRLSNSVKCGKNENTAFYDSAVQVRDKTSKIEFMSMKIPLMNDPSKVFFQPVVKITDTQTGKSVFTSLMNTIYWEMEEEEAFKADNLLNKKKA